MTFAILAAVATGLGACAPPYSPNIYAADAVQQANKVDRGIVIGYREVTISDDGTVGAVTGGAAGGILGAQNEDSSIPTALTALGGSVVGGLVGSTIQHATGDTTGWEYIIQETSGNLISVTQRQMSPLPVGQKVLVIEGRQARVVPDYSSEAYEHPSSVVASKTKPGVVAKATKASPARASSAAAAPRSTAPLATVVLRALSSASASRAGAEKSPPS